MTTFRLFTGYPMFLARGRAEYAALSPLEIDKLATDATAPAPPETLEEKKKDLKQLNKMVSVNVDIPFYVAPLTCSDIPNPVTDLIIGNWNECRRLFTFNPDYKIVMVTQAQDDRKPPSCASVLFYQQPAATQGR